MPAQPKEGSDTRVLNRSLLAVSILVVLIAMLAPPTAADTTYTVSTNPFIASHQLGILDLHDNYELVAANGDQVAYSMSIITGCARLYFYKGHNIDPETDLAYAAYSQTSCVMSYQNTFPVPASEGTEFSIVIINPNLQDVQYTLTVTVTPAPPGLPTWIIGAVIGIILIIVIIVVVVVLMVRRKKPAPAPPTAPPPYPGQQPAYPGAPPPPMYPQQPPQQPPQAPPPYGP